FGVGESQLDVEEPEIAGLGAQPLKERSSFAGVIRSHGADVNDAAVPEDDVQFVLARVAGHDRNLVETHPFYAMGACRPSLHSPSGLSWIEPVVERRNPGLTVTTSWGP